MLTTRVTGSGGAGLHALAWEPDRGAGVGRPVLLVHGLASNCRTWEAVGTRLAALGHPVLAVDLRGHGQSEKPATGYDFATLAADLACVLTSLGWARPLVVGQSTGGNLAVQLAAEHPELVGAVAGVDGGVIDLASRWPAWDDCERALAPPQMAGRPRRDVEAYLTGSHPNWSFEGVEATLANLEELADGTVRPWLTRDRHLAILRALWEQRPLEFVARVSVPILLLVASSDEAWRVAKEDASAAAAQANPGVRVERMAGGHDLHVEQPKAVAVLLHDLAAEADG